MTPEEIADAQEARAIIQHAKWMETSAAYLAAISRAQDAWIAASLRSERFLSAQIAAADAQVAIAAELPRSQRLAILVDSATERLTDRTAAGGAADVPKSVAEALAILAEVERQTAPNPLPPPPSPPPLDPPKPPGA